MENTHNCPSPHEIAILSLVWIRANCGLWLAVFREALFHTGQGSKYGLNRGLALGQMSTFKGSPIKTFRLFPKVAYLIVKRYPVSRISSSFRVSIRWYPTATYSPDGETSAVRL